MTRTKLFEAIRPFAPDKRFTTEHVAAIDALADSFGMGRIGNGNALVKAVTIIKEFEGCELEAYPDPGSGGDPWTIGVGHTGPDVKKGLIWTQAQADSALMRDIAKFSSGVAGLVKGVATTDYEMAALISFAFNVGLGALGNSTLLKKHNAGDKAGATSEFGRWTRASGKVLPGLARRRATEARVYQGGVA